MINACMGKRIATDMTKVLGQLDLSAITPSQHEEFKRWLADHSTMETTIKTALRHGFRVKAQSNTYRRQTEYWLRIEEPNEASED